MADERADAGEPRTVDVLVLTIGADVASAAQIAIPAAAVREVARADRLTPYPGAPADVPGVTAVRGQIVLVLDLTPATAGSRAVVLLAVGPRALALAGGTPVRVAAADAAPLGAGGLPHVRLWSGRVLPLAGTVRLVDVSRPDAVGGAVLPLLDASALIGDVVDDSDGGR